MQTQPGAAFVVRSCLRLPDPDRLMAVRSQNCRLPGTSDTAYAFTDLVAERVSGRRERHARRAVESHFQDLPQPIRNWQDAILAILRVLRAEHYLAAFQGDLAPPQREQLALTAAGLEGSDDQRLEVWFC